PRARTGPRPEQNEDAGPSRAEAYAAYVEARRGPRTKRCDGPRPGTLMGVLSTLSQSGGRVAASPTRPGPCRRRASCRRNRQDPCAPPRPGRARLPTAETQTRNRFSRRFGSLGVEPPEPLSQGHDLPDDRDHGWREADRLGL